MTNFRPLRGKVLVRKDPKRKVTQKGIFIPDTSTHETVVWGTIEAMGGPDPDWCSVGDLKVGSRVMFTIHAGMTNSQQTARRQSYLDDDHVLLIYKDILLVDDQD